MARRVPAGLVVALALYVALRFAIVWTSFEAVALPMYELFPMGTVAELRLRGVEFPLQLVYDNAAGQILMSLATVPVFAVFGSSYLALKVLPALLGLGVLVLVWVFLARNFSRRAANVGALMYAVGPPTLTKYSLINSGNHFENLFFVMLALVLAYRWHRGGASSRVGLALYAFACGFALFVFLGALIPVGILAGLHLGLRGVRRSSRDALVALPAFALGLAPLVVVNAATGGRGLGFLGAKFGGESSGRGSAVLERMGDFLGPHLWRSGVFEPFAGVSGPAWATVFLVAFAVAYLACLPSTLASSKVFAARLFRTSASADEDAHAFEQSKLVVFALYLPLAALAYGISNFRLGGHAAPVEVAGYRYYLPALLFGVLVIAVFVDRWWNAQGARRWAGHALLACGALPGLSSLAIVDLDAPDRGVAAKLDGYNLAQVGRSLISARNALSDERIIELVESFPPDMRFEVQSSLGFNLGVRSLESHREPADVIRTAVTTIHGFRSRFPPTWSDPLRRGVGTSVRWLLEQRGAGASLALELMSGLPADMWLPVNGPSWNDTTFEIAVGAASSNVGLLKPREVQGMLEANLSALEIVACRAQQVPVCASHVYGIGVVCGRMLARGVPSDVEWVHSSAPRFLDHEAERSVDRTADMFAAGLGEGFARREQSSRGTLEALLVDRPVRPGVARSFWKGYGRGLVIRYGARAESILDDPSLRALASLEDYAAARSSAERARTPIWTLSDDR